MGELCQKLENLRDENTPEKITPYFEEIKAEFTKVGRELMLIAEQRSQKGNAA